MKYAMLLSLLASGGGFYLHSQQPAVWNQIVATCQSSLQQVLANASRDVGESRPAFHPPDPLPARDNWTWSTLDGKTYQNVVVAKVEPDCVTILHHDGGARIDMANLPPDIQKQLNYDPSLAESASQERVQEDAASAASMDQEREEAKEVEIRKRADEDANVYGNLSPGNTGEKVVTDEQYATYQSDVTNLSGHLSFDATGQPQGDPYYVQRYVEERRFMTMHEQQAARRAFAASQEKPVEYHGESAWGHRSADGYEHDGAVYYQYGYEHGYGGIVQQKTGTGAGMGMMKDPPQTQTQSGTVYSR